MKITLPSTTLQISVAKALEQARNLHLRKALNQTVKLVNLATLNRELDENAPASDLRELASHGIRGELVFPVPCLLLENPRLIGYYRLLLGFSQKELYNKGALGRFAAMEKSGKLSPGARDEVPDLCKAFCQRSSELIAGLGVHCLTTALIDDLTLLTLGPQLRGSNNTLIGRQANATVFDIIQSIVNHAVVERSNTRLELENAAGRRVVISFSSDPDISIVEHTSKNATRNIVAIEIKGGEDQSNIWNRLGEAEKSHQSAKQGGFVEFWTIYNVRSLDPKKAREKSPTTNRFYSLPGLAEGRGEEFEDFRNRIASLAGIRNS